MTAMLSSLDAFTAKVEQFIHSHNETARSNGVAVTADSELIDSRLIDSLSFVEFLLFLEDHFDCEITASAGDIDVFRSVKSIHNRFHQAKEMADV
jgi:acyl carrier protein